MSKVVTLSLLAALAVSSPCFAQSNPSEPSTIWSHGTTLSALGGVATASSQNTGALAGGDLGWEITPQVALQGTGTWFDRGLGAGGFAAALTVQKSFGSPHPAAPFVTGGVGLYRAWFNTSQATNIPSFYSSRMTGPPGQTSYSFTDPTFVVGGGFNLFLSPHIEIRPDFEGVIVFNGSGSYVLATFVFRVAYHFETHPVTPR